MIYLGAQIKSNNQTKANKMYSKMILLSALLVVGAEAYAQNDSISKNQDLQEVKVVARRAGTSRLAGAVNGIAVNKDELFKAACWSPANQVARPFRHLRADAHRELA